MCICSLNLFVSMICGIGILNWIRVRFIGGVCSILFFCEAYWDYTMVDVHFFPDLLCVLCS